LVWIEAEDKIEFGRALKDETSTVDVDGIESKDVIDIKGKTQENVLITDELVEWIEAFIVLKNLANELDNFLLYSSFLFLSWLKNQKVFYHLSFLSFYGSVTRINIVLFIFVYFLSICNK